MSHPVIAMAAMIGVLVTVHELGHFIVGKLFGIGVETFSIGFGPAILRFQHQHTEYRLSWLPLGGYVQFAGMLPGEPIPEHFAGKDINSASNLAKSCTLVAGPLANVLLTLVVFWFMGVQGMEHRAAVVGEIRPDSPADLATLRSGDVISKIADEEIHTWEQLRKAVGKSEGSIEVHWTRGTQAMSQSITPEEPAEGQRLLGVSYGFLPSVATVLPGGLAATAGMKTGEKVVSLQWNGNTYPVERWADLGHHVFDLRQKGAETWNIKTQSGSYTIEANIPESPHLGVRGREENLKFLGLQSSQLTVEVVQESQPLQTKDVILQLGDAQVVDAFDVHRVLKDYKQSTIPAVVLRGGQSVTLDLNLKPSDVQLPEGAKTVYVIGAQFYGDYQEPAPYIEQYSLAPAFVFASQKTWSTAGSIVEGVYGLITGQVPVKALGGPILIAKVASDSAQAGLQVFLISLALISMNLAILNMLPIPVLDGGKLTIVLAEVVKGRALSQATHENFQRVGFALIVAMMVLAFYNDISRFWLTLLR